MKDFLHGRPSMASNRSSGPNISLPSNFPPISPGAGVGEPSPESTAVSPPSEEDLENSADTCAGEPQVEIVPDAEGRVGHIVVTCRCGEKITLQCNY